MTVLDKLLQPVWDISSEPIVITSNEDLLDDRKILHVNRAFTKTTGFTLSDAIGSSPTIVHGPATDPGAIHDSEQQLRSGQSQEYALLHYRKDRSTFHCKISRAPLMDVDSAHGRRW